MSANQNKLVASSGYFVVDLISRDDDFVASPGGTATNVLSALNSMEWETIAVGSVGDDPAGRFFSEVLSGDGVDVNQLRRRERWTTPEIIQVDRGGDHRWIFSCPHCGTRFAPSRPSPLSAAEDSYHLRPEVFVFDRANRFTIDLARHWRDLGTLVFFEPSQLGRPHLFEEAIDAAHVVKFSADRSAGFEERLVGVAAVLIKTLGMEGASVKHPSEGGWRQVQTTPTANFVDSVGAGDWTSAGFIDHLASKSARAIDSLEDIDLVIDAARIGVRLGGIACQWRGFRPPTWPLPPSSIVTSPDFYCPLLTTSR